MNQRSVRIIAEYLSQRPLARIVRLRRVGVDDYVLAIEDRRDGRVHLLRTPLDLEVWLQSFEARECLQPDTGLCGRCDRIHGDRDIDGEVFANCIPCQADLVEAALEVSDEQEAEGQPACGRSASVAATSADRPCGHVPRRSCLLGH